MAHLLERAPTGRAKCRGCGRAIAAKDWRFGERLPNPFADGEGAEMTHWFHPTCAAFKRPEALIEFLAGATEPVDGRDVLQRQADAGISHRRLPRVDVASVAPSGRAMCRHCRAAIDKGLWRIALVYYEDGRFGPSGYIHLTCAKDYLETSDFLDRLVHFSPDLSDADIKHITALI